MEFGDIFASGEVTVTQEVQQLSEGQLHELLEEADEKLNLKVTFEKKQFHFAGAWDNLIKLETLIKRKLNRLDCVNLCATKCSSGLNEDSNRALKENEISATNLNLSSMNENSGEVETSLSYNGSLSERGHNKTTNSTFVEEVSDNHMTTNSVDKLKILKTNENTNSEDSMPSLEHVHSDEMQYSSDFSESTVDTSRCIKTQQHISEGSNLNSPFASQVNDGDENSELQPTDVELGEKLLHTPYGSFNSKHDDCETLDLNLNVEDKDISKNRERSKIVENGNLLVHDDTNNHGNSGLGHILTDSTDTKKTNNTEFTEEHGHLYSDNKHFEDMEASLSQLEKEYSAVKEKKNSEIKGNIKGLAGKDDGFYDHTIDDRESNCSSVSKKADDNTDKQDEHNGYHDLSAFDKTDNKKAESFDDEYYRTSMKNTQTTKADITVDSDDGVHQRQSSSFMQKPGNVCHDQYMDTTTWMYMDTVYSDQLNSIQQRYKVCFVSGSMDANDIQVVTIVSNSKEAQTDQAAQAFMQIYERTQLECTVEVVHVTKWITEALCSKAVNEVNIQYPNVVVRDMFQTSKKYLFIGKSQDALAATGLFRKVIDLPPPNIRPKCESPLYTSEHIGSDEENHDVDSYYSDSEYAKASDIHREEESDMRKYSDTSSYDQYIDITTWMYMESVYRDHIEKLKDDYKVDISCDEDSDIVFISIKASPDDENIGKVTKTFNQLCQNTQHDCTVEVVHVTCSKITCNKGVRKVNKTLPNVVIRDMYDKHKKYLFIGKNKDPIKATEIFSDKIGMPLPPGREKSKKAKKKVSKTDSDADHHDITKRKDADKIVPLQTKFGSDDKRESVHTGDIDTEKPGHVSIIIDTPDTEITLVDPTSTPSSLSPNRFSKDIESDKIENVSIDSNVSEISDIHISGLCNLEAEVDKKVKYNNKHESSKKPIDAWGTDNTTKDCTDYSNTSDSGPDDDLYGINISTNNENIGDDFDLSENVIHDTQPSGNDTISDNTANIIEDVIIPCEIVGTDAQAISPPIMSIEVETDIESLIKETNTNKGSTMKDTIIEKAENNHERADKTDDSECVDCGNISDSGTDDNLYGSHIITHSNKIENNFDVSESEVHVTQTNQNDITSDIVSANNSEVVIFADKMAGSITQDITPALSKRFDQETNIKSIMKKTNTNDDNIVNDTVIANAEKRSKTADKPYDDECVDHDNPSDSGSDDDLYCTNVVMNNDNNENNFDTSETVIHETQTNGKDMTSDTIYVSGTKIVNIPDETGCTITEQITLDGSESIEGETDINRIMLRTNTSIDNTVKDVVIDTCNTTDNNSKPAGKTNDSECVDSDSVSDSGTDDDLYGSLSNTHKVENDLNVKETEVHVKYTHENTTISDETANDSEVVKSLDETVVTVDITPVTSRQTEGEADVKGIIMKTNTNNDFSIIDTDENNFEDTIETGSETSSAKNDIEITVNVDAHADIVKSNNASTNQDHNENQSVDSATRSINKLDLTVSNDNTAATSRSRCTDFSSERGDNHSICSVEDDISDVQNELDRTNVNCPSITDMNTINVTFKEQNDGSHCSASDAILHEPFKACDEKSTLDSDGNSADTTECLNEATSSDHDIPSDNPSAGVDVSNVALDLEKQKRLAEDTICDTTHAISENKPTAEDVQGDKLPTEDNVSSAWFDLDKERESITLSKQQSPTLQLLYELIENHEADPDIEGVIAELLSGTDSMF